MNTGDLNNLISLSTLTESISSGDVTATWSTAVTVRAKITMIDGTRYLSQGELIDKTVYKIELWDNNYSDNIKITYGSLVLYPIRPITRNAGIGSKLNEITILAAVKK